MNSRHGWSATPPLPAGSTTAGATRNGHFLDLTIGGNFSRPAMHVLVVDDHALVREGIRMLLEAIGLFEQVIECASLNAALQEVQRDLGRFGLILLDLNMPDAKGLEAVQQMRRYVPDTPILVVSADSQAAIIDGALARGAQGYLPKNASGTALRTAVNAVLLGQGYTPSTIVPPKRDSPSPEPSDPEPSGQSRLTPRQAEVLLLLAKGYANKEIADALSLSLSTVRVHVSAVLERLGVENRTQAATSSTAQLLLARGLKP